MELLPREKRVVVEAGSSQGLAARDTAIRNKAVELLLEKTRDGTPERRVVIAAIGAVTDIASVLISDPSLANRVEIVAMGFESWPNGGDPWNVKNDVMAWQVLLDAPVPIVVGDCAVTNVSLRMSSEEASRRLVPHGGWLSGALCVALGTWLVAHPELAERTTGSRESWPIWDEVIVAHLLGMTEIDEHPRPALRDNLTFDHGRPNGTIRWVRSIDSERLWSDLAENLSRANTAGR
jgi:inosine-uridine nucleoside N-ribohydrolase